MECRSERVSGSDSSVRAASWNIYYFMIGEVKYLAKHSEPLAFSDLHLIIFYKTHDYDESEPIASSGVPNTIQYASSQVKHHTTHIF